LNQKGGYEDIKHNLTVILERDYRADQIAQKASEQALGKAPRDFPGRMACKKGSSP
jgi:hypothetical protein